ncbi:MAG TPA: glycoside hydrolase family 15 protein [Bryobacteraceae bacterium]|nr:glycoside hydrolase family 15 protein [Bryobacteraceae bacterium]
MGVLDPRELVVHNQDVGKLIRPAYSRERIDEVADLLRRRGTLAFPTLPSGLFAAAAVDSEHYTGYGNVWVRDTVHIAHALWRQGQIDTAVNAVNGLMRHFRRQRDRFREVIEAPERAADPMRRPHIRFDGMAETDVTEPWAHAQNDSLGYFLWLYSKLAVNRLISVDAEAWRTLALFPPYLRAIQFWSDEDSGHWEEGRKVEASSIGAVCAGLKALGELVHRARLPEEVRRADIAGQATDLLDRGTKQLHAILPWECREQETAKKRRYDSALLFLVFPLRIVADRAAAMTIVGDVRDNLQGRYGIKRYLGDSFWCTDYRKRVGAADRTKDYSKDMVSRDRYWRPDSEAQWCLFDPILSVIYGDWFMELGRAEMLELQAFHLNRSLGQITGTGERHAPFKCPELYHLEGAEVEPSDAVPLLWTQANLLLALEAMRRSLEDRKEKFE